MIRCRKSAKVSRAASPSCCQVLGGQRLGGDHQRVHRRDAAPQARQPGAETLGRPQHQLGPQVAVLGADPAGLDRQRRGPLVDRHAQLLDPAGQRPGQLGRMDRRAVRGVHPAQHRGGGQPAGRLGGVEQFEVVEAERPGLLDLLDGPAQLRLAAGQRDGSAGGPVGVQAVGRDHPAHLGDGVLQGAVLPDGGVPAVLAGQRRQRHRVQRRAPAAVAPGCPEPGDLGLDHGDPQCRGRPGAGSRRSTGRCSRRPRSRRRRSAPPGRRRPATAGGGVPRRPSRASRTGRGSRECWECWE